MLGILIRRTNEDKYGESVKVEARRSGIKITNFRVSVIELIFFWVTSVYAIANKQFFINNFNMESQIEEARTRKMLNDVVNNGERCIKGVNTTPELSAQVSHPIGDKLIDVKNSNDENEVKFIPSAKIKLQWNDIENIGKI